jgi:hypothetical protein
MLYCYAKTALISKLGSAVKRNFLERNSFEESFPCVPTLVECTHFFAPHRVDMISNSVRHIQADTAITTLIMFIALRLTYVRVTMLDFMCAQQAIC